MYPASRSSFAAAGPPSSRSRTDDHTFQPASGIRDGCLQATDANRRVPAFIDQIDDAIVQTEINQPWGMPLKAEMSGAT